MSYLHRKPQLPDASGRIQHITPENAGWRYVGFEVVLLKAGDSRQFASGAELELCAVLLSGRVNVSSVTLQADNIGERMSVFAGIAPYARGATPFTVLVPTDRVFSDLPQIRQELLPQSSEDFPDASNLIRFIRSHVLYGLHAPESFQGRRQTFQAMGAISTATRAQRTAFICTGGISPTSKRPTTALPAHIMGGRIRNSSVRASSFKAGHQGVARH